MNGREKKVRKLPIRRANNNGSMTKHHDHVSEEILIEILARLPLRSIRRFKSVCKTWKSVTETDYFRRHFLSLHKNSSSSWSLVVGTKARDLISLHRCETWDLPKSLACYIQSHITIGHVNYVASSNGLVFMDGYKTSFVGNPVLQQWVRIPSPPYPFVTLPFCLVTRVDDDGVVLGFKVVRIAGDKQKRQESLTMLCLCVYSSETGVWSKKRLDCSHYFTNWGLPMALNGTLFISPEDIDDPAAVSGALIAHDFYGEESDLCRVIPLPDHDLDHNWCFKRALTTSAGSVMYIKTLAHNLFKTHNFKILSEEEESTRHIDDGLEKCVVNQSTCEQLMNARFDPDSLDHCVYPLTLFHFALPRWTESLPCPPQVEMMDTTSLLSYILVMEGNRKEFKDTFGIRERLLPGGLMGYLKRGSKISLVAGGGSAALFYYVYTELPGNPVLASSIGIVGSAALTGMMGSRYLRTRKVVPAGVVSVVSLVMTGAYLHGLILSS
ncbi:F-box domain [Arabidopsis thaliana x Arabidopsis arenosa]|uniref:F-box domain n=1 Tax=Arabidopsis thaliana x Arabidopsis arenosa TaxID=1240361 RepID=A0A8T2BFY0_9BRAS|nr:F-box domain [Arabidopsis thaliana x Arabidopsis arenosa]